MAVDLLTILKTIGIPVAYQIFKTPQKPPYIIYRFVDTENISADDKVYHTAENHRIELYTDNRDRMLEGKIQAALDQNEIYWERTETYLDMEKVLFVTYDIQI